jgi:integrase
MPRQRPFDVPSERRAALLDAGPGAANQVLGRHRPSVSSHLIIDLALDVAQVSRILGHARITITLDIYTHLFEDARHTGDIRTRTATSPFAALLEPTTAAPGATVLKLR